MTPVMAAELVAGDVIHCPNWQEHVVRAWPDGRGIAVVVEEFPTMVLHFPLAQIVQVDQ